MDYALATWLRTSMATALPFHYVLLQWHAMKELRSSKNNRMRPKFTSARHRIRLAVDPMWFGWI